MPRLSHALARLRILRLLSCALLLCAGMAATAHAAAPVKASPLRFGILPIGGPAESKRDWQPLLDDLAQALGRPVQGVSVSSYEGIHQAIAEGRIDAAFLSGKLALDSVLDNDMEAMVRFVRVDGSPGYTAVLVARRDGPVRNLADVLDKPGRWRYARGETLSMSGYLVPEAQLFARRGLSSDLHFRAVSVDTHQNNALAVANGEADVASNNSADLERFAAHFPQQSAQLRVLWRSGPIPHAVLVASHKLPAQTRATLRTFLTGYGRGPNAAQQRRNLLQIHELAGFEPIDNRALLPFAEIEHTLKVRQAMSARWVDEKARQQRLQKLRDEYESVKARLER